VKLFLGVFPSGLLPHSITQPGTFIVNTDPHTKRGSHWLAVNFQPKSYSGNYFDSYGLAPYISSIKEFLKRTCNVSEYNKTQLQGMSSTVCGKYCCIFALYTDRGYTPKHFLSLFERDEIIVKKLSLAAEIVIQTFHFQSPYEMEPHGSEA
jgi:hypothetical protein